VGVTNTVEPVNTSDGYTSSYELFRNGVTTGLTLAGTGGTINFPNQTLAGTYTVKETLTLTSGTNTCGGSMSANSLVITIDANVQPSPVSAGPNQTVCAQATMAGSTPIVGTGLWSIVSGSGTITTPTSPTTTVTALGTGANTLKWKLTNGTCADSNTVVITANQPNVAPTALNASPALICKGSSVILTQTGGSLGTNAKWQWYSDAGYTIKVGGLLSSANASLTVSPTVTTTYYIQAEGATAPCTANTSFGSVTVTVNQPNVAPTALNAAPAVICNGSSTTLTQTGGSLGTNAQWQWYSDAGFTTKVGPLLSAANASLTVSPTITTTYYLRAEGAALPCGANTPFGGSITITVNNPNVAPTALNASLTVICNGAATNVTLTQTGGSLGTNAKWQWYSDAGFTTKVGGLLSSADASLTVSPTITTTYYIRAEGATAPCTANTSFGSVTITVNEPPLITVQPSLSPACLFDVASISASGSGTGLSYKWQVSTDGGISWSYLSDGAIFSGTNTQTVNISPADTGLLSYYFRLELNGAAPCGSIQSTAIPMRFINEWLGTANTNWNTNTNWVNNTLPDFNSCSWLVIPGGITNFPKLDVDRTIPNIAIVKGSNLDLNNQTLTVGGRFVGTGKLKGSAASGLIIQTNGDAGTVYFDTTGPGNQLKTLTVNLLNSELKLGDDGIGSRDTVNIVAGNSTDGYGTVIVNGDLDANGVLTLKSNANGTARVGVSYGIISGDVTVERYIPPLRAWRFLTVPFNTSSQMVRDAWQEGVNNFGLDYNTFNKNPHPGYGTHITGNNNSNLGWDFNTTQNPSYKVWNSAGTGFDVVEPPTISTPITSYSAYAIFVRGSRAVKLSLGTAAPTDPTVLRATGTLNQTGVTATLDYSVTTAGKVAFLGNPYASSIDLHDLLQRSTGIDTSKFWTWDPKITGTGTDNVGGYVSYSNGVIVPPVSPSYPDVASAFRIQSGQAFMVQLSAGSTTATMDFRESDKIVSEANVFGLRANRNTASYPVIYTNLMARKEGVTGLLDGVGAGLSKKFSSAVNAVDAVKLWNFDENIALMRDGQALAIELRQPPVVTDTLFYKLSLKQRHYALKIFAANLVPGSSPEAWLIDKYMDKKIVVNLLDTTVYKFEPTSDSNSFSNRFMLVFRNIKENISGAENNIADMANIKTGGTVVLYPNPVITGNATLQFANMDKGNYEVTVYNPIGQKLASRDVQHNGGSNNYVLPLKASWPGGVYRINVTHKDSGKGINLTLVIGR
jgi:hypothetical protein